MTKRRVEPILWLLFSAGGVLAAVFLPVLVVLFGLAFPLGWVTPPSHAHLHAVLGHPLTALFLFGLFALCLAHWAHRFRYTLYDGLQLKGSKGLITVLCYGGALVGSVVSAVVLVTVV
ncbi:MAG: fumarate reductase subunit FrdD [Nocardioidaceae bacterium]